MKSAVHTPVLNSVRASVRACVIASVALLGMSACASSKSSTSADTNSAISSPVGTNATAEGTPTTNVAPVVTAVGNDDSIRARIVAEIVAAGPLQGLNFDAACVTGLVGQLSPTDIQAFRDNFRDPKVSKEGASLGETLYNDCGTPTTSTT